MIEKFRMCRWSIELRTDNCNIQAVVARVLILAAGVLGLTSPALSQAADTSFPRYTAMVDAYRAGDRAAITELGTWPVADVGRVLGEAAAAGTRFAEAAALLHTEVAAARATADWDRSAAHLAAAGALAQSLPSQEETFVQRQYTLAASILLSRGDADAARQWVDRGLTLDEFSAPLRTAAGAIEELLAHLADPECTGRDCTAGTANGSNAVHLHAAERHYRTALQRDAMFAEAHLRLGRVLSILGNEQEADAELAAAVSSPSPRVRYLAHLFRADLATRRPDEGAARREYEAARMDMPGAQTPYFALSHLDEAAGNAGRARETLAQFTRRESSASADPWWGYQNGALDDDTLQWLIAYVRQQPR
jgi:hypothetical protein